MRELSLTQLAVKSPLPRSNAIFPSWLMLTIGCIALQCVVCSRIQAQELDVRLLKQFQEVVRPTLQKHCGDCHMGDANEAGVSFEAYQGLEKIREHVSTWEQIRGVIRAEAMPPPDSSSMTTEERGQVASWIQSALHDVECDCEIPTPPVTVRRLNQVEYDNTIRDLFGIDASPSKEIGFVSDDVGNGFDNQGEVLTLPPIMLEKYMQAAASISKQVVRTDREELRKQRFDGEQLRHGAALTQKLFLAAGNYNLNIRMRFGDNLPDKCHVVAKMDETLLGEWDVATKEENYKVDFDAKEGWQTLTVTYVNDETPEKKDEGIRRLFIDSVRINGPKEGFPAFPETHQRFVTAYPEQKDAPDLSEIGLSEASRRVFSVFLPRAYRRPVTEDEVHGIVVVCEKASDAGYSYLESLRFGLQAALVSPSFLFRTEKRIDGQGIDDYAIASRLSYFLWSSMPDEGLFAEAAAGRLHEPERLAMQVQRMLESPKSEALVKGFFGQWLGLRNLNKIDIDRSKYPGWNDRLRAAMIKESEMFCQYLLKEGTLDDITGAEFTFVNPRLAEFYGMEYDGRNPAEMYQRKVRGRGDDNRRMGSYENENDWIRAPLPQQRKGLLTHAAVLALTSNPTRTSPVKRGKWILENVIGDPPPSAPPGVPGLEAAKAAENASLRERLEIHRANPSCAGCHKIMDPIGLGLENFDAIGRWRDKENDKAIEPRGELTDGRQFEGPRELVGLLSDRKDQIARNLANRMLVYALGRGLQRVDRCVLDKVLQYNKDHGETLRSLVEAIVQSDAFLQTPTLNPTLRPIPQGTLSDAK